MANILPTLAIGEYLGIRPAVAVGTNTGGNSFVDHLHWAAYALQARLCNVALICYGSNQRTGKSRRRTRRPMRSPTIHGSRYPHTRWRPPAICTSTAQPGGSCLRRRRRPAMGERNPIAFSREPLSMEEVLASRMVCDPLSLLDCCLVTDGAGAVVLVRAERAARGSTGLPSGLRQCANASPDQPDA